MILESPLLQLEEYNTDVWEMLMIELVKCRMKYVISDFKEVVKDYGIKKYQEYHHFTKRINKGRMLIYLINNIKKPIQTIESHFHSKYFVYGFILEVIKQFIMIPTGVAHNGVGHYQLTTPIKVVLYKSEKFSEILRTLSYKNNFEDEINSLDDSNIFKFLCEQEEKENKVSYCVLSDQIH